MMIFSRNVLKQKFDRCSLKVSAANFSTVKTGIVMLNMGGPTEPNETGPFLKRLFNDQDIIDLGGGRLQALLGDFVSWRRTPKITEQYESIGGSPIRKWTDYQGVEMCKILDKISPESAPHKAYTCFRYTHPLTEEVLPQMKEDGVQHAVAFSQFPQWSCTTSGSSANELWRRLKEFNMESEFKWSVIDRWGLHDGFINAVIDRINTRLSSMSGKNPTILFSAHSVPMKVVEKGDHYVPEVCATVLKVMERLNASRNNSLKHVLAWQSKVGYMPWMVPSTASALEKLGKRGVKSVLVVPVAFTSDHIETLFEIGEEYKEEAEKVGIENFEYTEGLNGSEIFIQAQADIVKKHLDAKLNHSSQYKQRCLDCKKPLCRQVVNPMW